MTREDEVRAIHYKYLLKESQINEILDSGVRYADLDKAALLSVMTKKPVEDILWLRKKNPWGRVEKKLGLTDAVYADLYKRARAERLSRFYGIDEERAFSLLSEGYPNHWIRLAFLLEQHTGMKTEDILARRTKEIKWKPWAEKELHVPEEEFSRWILETRNPSLKPKA